MEWRFVFFARHAFFFEFSVSNFGALRLFDAYIARRRVVFDVLIARMLGWKI